MADDGEVICRLELPLNWMKRHQAEDELETLGRTDGYEDPCSTCSLDTEELPEGFEDGGGWRANEMVA